METLDTIRAVAQEVREWAEEQESGWTNLNGYCAIASAELHKRLKAQGIDTKLHMADDNKFAAHVFLVIDDHVVDVTATQFREFRYEPIVILHEREAQQHWFYESTVNFATVDELRSYQVQQKWPQHQIARR